MPLKHIALTVSTLAITLVTPALAGHGDRIPGKYIVILHDQQTPARALNEVFKDIGLKRSDRAKQIEVEFTEGVTGFSGHLTPAQLSRLQNHPEVRFIEQDIQLHLDPDEYVVDSQMEPKSQITGWGVTRVGGSAPAPAGKTAWVIDSGATPNHPDIHFDLVRSKSFISGDASIVDTHGHGTAVASVIGAKDNSTGTVGVAAGATIVALKTFSATSNGTLTRFYSATNHVLNNGQAGDVMNLSVKISSGNSLWDSLLQQVSAKGIHVVIAAGNGNDDCSNYSPARVNGTNIYTISGMNTADTMTASSSYGAPVDFAAASEGVPVSTVSGGTARGYGTSFAAPHVAGILLLQGHVQSDGYISGDKDSTPDPIAHR